MGGVLFLLYTLILRRSEVLSIDVVTLGWHIGSKGALHRKAGYHLVGLEKLSEQFTFVHHTLNSF